VKVLGHDDISGYNKIVLGPHLFQDVQKQIPPTHPIQELLPTVAAAGDEMPVTGMMESPQTLRHG
jgi:hypothetical protein